MGYKLRREVRDLLPAGLLTPSERLLLLEVADTCNDDTREGWPGVEWLAEKCDVPTTKRVGEHFAGIARKWFEVRVELGKDKHGKPFYAMPRKRTTYRMPTRAELVNRHGEDKVPKIQGLDACKAPENQGAKVPEFQGGSPPDFGDPSPQGTPQKSTSQPPPTPSSTVAVVEAEIVEEGEGATSSVEEQINTLVGEVVKIRPGWKRHEIRTFTEAALTMCVDSIDALRQLVLATASDPTTAKPSRITASGNPHLQAMSTALMIARLDAVGDHTVMTPPECEFEPDPASKSYCDRCKMPKANRVHLPGRSTARGYTSPKISTDRQPRRPPGQREPWQPPADEREYDRPFTGQVRAMAPGSTISKNGGYIRMHDSHHEDRDYNADA